MLSFLVTVLLAVAACADPIQPITNYPSGRIVGGENAVIETYPYQISLEYLGRHNCGGSIISKYYILTAGHCVRSADTLSVRAGTTFHGQGGSVHKVVEVIRHENYKTNSRGVPVNDIAVMRVEEPFQFDETRQPISLYGQYEESAPGVSSVITGWGSTGGWGSPSQLQTVAVPIITKTLCDEAYKSFGGLPAGQICAAFYGVGGKDACQGDSGGPLAIDGRLAGVVSWGNGCAQPYYPGVYTEVAHFKDWIEKHVQF